MTDALQIVLAKRPVGDVTADCFRQESVTLPALADGQVLIRSRYLSLDPYMRPRMTELRSYTPPFELDKPLDEQPTQAGQGMMKAMTAMAGGKRMTLREIAQYWGMGVGMMPIIGTPSFSARSISLTTFSANTSPSEPPNTVKSCEKTQILRPSTVP